MQDPLAVETLALSFKAVCIHWLPAATVPCGEQSWALLATLLALALTEVRGAVFHRQLF